MVEQDRKRKRRWREGRREGWRQPARREGRRLPERREERGIEEGKVMVINDQGKEKHRRRTWRL